MRFALNEDGLVFGRGEYGQINTVIFSYITNSVDIRAYDRGE